jgi:hypothetical protein
MRRDSLKRQLSALEPDPVRVAHFSRPLCSMSDEELDAAFVAWSLEWGGNFA